MRKFNGNNVIKGRVQMQMPMYIKSGAISFEKGTRRNTCIIIIDERKIPKSEVSYLIEYVLGANREIK